MTDETGRLLSDIARMDFWARKRAIAELIKHPEEQYTRFLEDCIRNHEDADLRNAAMEVYSALGVRAYPSIRTLIKDADPEARLFAVNVLHRINDEGALPLLLSAVRDPDENVRTASAEALGALGNETAIPALRASLRDEPWVAMAAINAMGEIGGDEARMLLHECLALDGCAEITIAALKRAGNRDSIRFLTKCLIKEGLVEPALDAIVAIAAREGLRPQPEYFINFVPMLLKMFESRTGEVRRHAFTALCWSEDIRGLSCMVDAVRDEGLQEQAIEGLLHIGRKAVCAIVDELKGSTGCHRVILAKVLSMIGEETALLQFWQDEDPEVRVEVALAIGNLGLKRASDALLSLLSDPYEEVRAAAKKSLSESESKM